MKTLTEGVLKLMFLMKRKVATAVLLMIAMVAASAGDWCLPYVQTRQKHGRHISPQQEGSEGRLFDDNGEMGSAAILPGFSVAGQSDDNDAKAVLDKTIQALGGETRLRQAKTLARKARGKSVNNGNEYPFTNGTTVQGLDQIWMEYDNEIDGNRVMGAAVLDGDKVWRKNGADIT